MVVVPDELKLQAEPAWNGAVDSSVGIASVDLMP